MKYVALLGLLFVAACASANSTPMTSIESQLYNAQLDLGAADESALVYASLPECVAARAARGSSPCYPNGRKSRSATTTNCSYDATVKKITTSSVKAHVDLEAALTSKTQVAADKATDSIAALVAIVK